MELHLEAAARLADIDRHVPPGATLYLLDVNYYGDAQRGVYERAGLIRGDITTVYAPSRDFRPETAEFYVQAQRPMQLEALGAVTELRPGLYHVVRDS